MNPEFWYVHLPNFLLQSLLVIWFLRPMEVVGTVGFGRRILSYVSFLLLLPLFMSTQFNLTYNIWSTTLRFFYRAVVYVVYLRLRKNSPYGAAMYASLLLVCIYTVCQSFFRHPFYLTQCLLSGSTFCEILFISPFLLLAPTCCH